jgi:predicted component of type VI protein secretion system
MSTETRVTLESAIEQAIHTFEPRVNLIGVKVTADPDRNGYDVTIVYVPVNEGSPINLDFFLNRLR